MMTNLPNWAPSRVGVSAALGIGAGPAGHRLDGCRMHRSPSGSALLVDVDTPAHVRRVYVLTGYRPLMKKEESLLKASMVGLFTLHNETLNVWSHLIGVVWALLRVLWLVNLPSEALSATMPEGMRTSVGLFLSTAIFCLGASVTAHLFAPIVSREPSIKLWRVDSYGICVLIGGSYVPALQFGFRCRPGWRNMYSGLVLMMLLAGAWGSATAEAGRRNLAERVRVGSLVFTVVFGLVPLTHFCSLAPSDEVAIFMPPILRMLIIYGVGFVFYGSGFPESLRPGGWDLKGGSHLLWHLAVLSAVRCFDGGVETMLLHSDDYVCQGWPPP